VPNFKVRSAKMGELSSSLWDSWCSLSPYDVTVVQMPDEREMATAALSVGGEILLVEASDAALARLLWKPLASDPTIAALGFLALQPGASQGFKTLINAVSERSAQRGVKKCIGPMNINTWFPYRIRCDQDSLSFPWEPRAYPELLSCLKEQGFVRDARYLSTGSSGFTNFLNHLEKDLASALAKGFTFEHLTPALFAQGAIAELHRISLTAFRSNSYFEDLSLEWFLRFYLKGSGPAQDSYTVLARDAKGRFCGFFYSFYEPSTSDWVLKSIGVDPQYRGHGLSNAMICYLAQHILPRQPDNYISALLMAGLPSASYARHGQTLWTHEYDLMSKKVG
jgi:GNAT superfamily N-acetyltransferase